MFTKNMASLVEDCNFNLYWNNLEQLKQNQTQVYGFFVVPSFAAFFALEVFVLQPSKLVFFGAWQRSGGHLTTQSSNEERRNVSKHQRTPP